MNKLLIFCLVISCCSCKKLTEFNINNSSEFVVPQTAALGVPLPSNMQVPTSSSFQFQSNGTDSKYVQEVKLEKLTLTVIDPASQTFSFVNSIHLYISADGLPEIQLAYIDDIPANAGNSIELITTGGHLDAYIKQENYQLRVETIIDELLSEDATIRADMVFKVKAKLL